MIVRHDEYKSDVTTSLHVSLCFNYKKVSKSYLFIFFMINIQYRIDLKQKENVKPLIIKDPRMIDRNYYLMKFLGSLKNCLWWFVIQAMILLSLISLKYSKKNF